jgi:uncharacterized protein (DUF2252 family)
MDILTATKDFEKWVSGHTHVVKSQLAAKHQQMAESPIQFLRTFYWWTRLFPEICPELHKTPSVLAVGDLHIASFGTWRDGYGRLIWGIDDFDEAVPQTDVDFPFRCIKDGAYGQAHQVVRIR